jgi:hypothetical protein
MAKFRAIHADPEFRADVHPQMAEEGDGEAIGVLLRMMQRVFDVQAFSEETESGLTEGEQIALYIQFCAYIESLKKTISRSPTLPPSVEESTSESSSEPNTKPTSDSGSTSQGSSSGAPMLSASE